MVHMLCVCVCVRHANTFQCFYEIFFFIYRVGTGAVLNHVVFMHSVICRLQRMNVYHAQAYTHAHIHSHIDTHNLKSRKPQTMVWLYLWLIEHCNKCPHWLQQYKCLYTMIFFWTQWNFCKHIYILYVDLTEAEVNFIYTSAIWGNFNEHIFLVCRKRIMWSAFHGRDFMGFHGAEADALLLLQLQGA